MQNLRSLCKYSLFCAFIIFSLLFLSTLGKIMCEEEKALQECGKQSAKCREDIKNDTKGYKCECEDGYEMENGICTSKYQRLLIDTINIYFYC